MNVFWKACPEKKELINLLCLSIISFTTTLCSNVLQISTYGHSQPRKQLSIHFSRECHNNVDLFLLILSNTGIPAFPINSAQPYKFLSSSTMTYSFGGLQNSIVPSLDILEAIKWIVITKTHNDICLFCETIKRTVPCNAHMLSRLLAVCTVSRLTVG